MRERGGEKEREKAEAGLISVYPGTEAGKMVITEL